MTHLPYIAASYGLFAALALAYTVQARWRLARACRRLRALDPRTSRTAAP